MPALRRGSPDGADDGYHVTQGGTCHACGGAVVRVVRLSAGPVLAADWELVAAPAARRVPHRRFG